LSGHEALKDTVATLSQLDWEPVTTVYLQYPPSVRLPVPMVGLEDSLSQWVFDRRVANQPGLMAVVISAGGDHMRLTTAELTARVGAELALAFPHWPAYGRSQVLREKRATFSANVAVEGIRPCNRTRIPGLWLAGDYTATGLPATLESAVRSGQACAEALSKTLAGENC